MVLREQLIDFASLIELELDFPEESASAQDVPEILKAMLGSRPVWFGKNRMDYLAEFNTVQEVLDFKPDFRELVHAGVRGLMITAKNHSNDSDFVSRFFAPRAGINEDPVTGSAHCMLIPFWAERLTKNKLEALQLSKRVGSLSCEFKGERVEIAGKAVTYLIGEINI